MYQCDITLWSWESVTLLQIKFRLAICTESKSSHILTLWYITCRCGSSSIQLYRSQAQSYDGVGSGALKRAQKQNGFNNSERRSKLHTSPLCKVLLNWNIEKKQSIVQLYIRFHMIHFSVCSSPLSYKIR